ncbi:MAG: PIN domain-containing protein [Deltaproteobacteria bacterium]|nr:MAG: PIN domain-containing protein [Deltaproteobacteria bacterium]
MDAFVLDTSAIVTFHENEPGADQIAQILKKAKARQAKVYIPFMSFMEFYYGVYRLEGKGPAIKAYMELKLLSCEQVLLSESLLLLAGEVKATHRMSLGDSWVAATAIQQKACLIHKDPEFEPLSSKVSLMTLPYKSRKM